MTGTDASDLSFESLSEGDAFEGAYVIEADVVEAFLRAFDDRSPIHVDDEYARRRGYPSRVAHGALLNGFLSHFVGMRVPGRRGLLQAVDLQYTMPCFVGDALKLRVTVLQKSESTRTVVLGLTFHNDTRGTIAARGRAQVGIGS
jgi:acyl dehydratase